MGIRLADALHDERVILLSGGVTITFRPFTFAEFVEEESSARRFAKGQLLHLQDATADMINGDLPPSEYLDRIEGIVAETYVDSMVKKFATAWNGIWFGEDDELAALTPENWIRFRKAVPQLAMELLYQLKAPMAELVSEGNVSTSSPNGDVEGATNSVETAKPAKASS